MAAIARQKRLCRLIYLLKMLARRPTLIVFYPFIYERASAPAHPDTQLLCSHCMRLYEERFRRRHTYSASAPMVELVMCRSLTVSLTDNHESRDALSNKDRPDGTWPPDRRRFPIIAMVAPHVYIPMIPCLTLSPVHMPYGRLHIPQNTGRMWIGVHA